MKMHAFRPALHYQHFQDASMNQVKDIVPKGVKDNIFFTVKVGAYCVGS